MSLLAIVNIFLATATVILVFLVCGNLLVMCAVLRRKTMRTARNIFIFNLALSDFLLATSIPFTVYDALTRAWTLPYSGIGCRWVGHNAKPSIYWVKLIAT